MKLYNYIKLMPEGEELTVWDIDYDMEVYFYGDKPAVNDYLYLSYPLTKEKILNIGLLTSECGNDILSEDDDDFVKLEHEGKITYLKRIYG